VFYSIGAIVLRATNPNNFLQQKKVANKVDNLKRMTTDIQFISLLQAAISKLKIVTQLPIHWYKGFGLEIL
jgi:hypothetical protein